MKGLVPAGVIAMVIILAGLVANLLLNSGCSGRKAAVRIESKASESDSSAKLKSNFNHQDTSKQVSLTTQFSNEDIEDQTTWYFTPGTAIQFGPDGSYTGKADSAKTKRRHKKQAGSTNSLETKKGITEVSSNKAKVDVSKHSTEKRKDKETERKGIDPGITIGIGIVCIALLIFVFRRL
ncbi:hypothetical protein KHS38_12155 [Mucilaginibacter sp. Bleaf8]|uniref:hypothetical protein n=1 Tax=Mucilaginibacter sp. Bleaf8 TaxID=2834430 RepID=UPI001BD12B93|nr:hypothetical protein [Mucilaginibacter sp. Bleaf8]MBS7565158.1 hypothetical protein [Mucilaginibacter sp. Bleaf8]